MDTDLLVHLVRVNVLAALSFLWFRQLSYKPHTGVVGMLVDMILCLIGLLLIVNAIVEDIVFLATVME